MRCTKIVLALLLIGLTACSSTATRTPNTAARDAAPATTSTPTASAPTRPSGPITPSMAQLQLDGEQYATLGDPNAPVTMIDFSDYGCPFCRLYAGAALPELKARYIDTGKVYYVFKDFPITELHPQARLAAQAAECAGEQGKYWDMHAKLFDNAQQWDTTPDVAQAEFQSYAEALSMNLPAFKACMAEERYAAEVQADFVEARSLGLQGTPAFIINGKLMSGARPIEQFVQVLDRELANKQ